MNPRLLTALLLSTLLTACGPADEGDIPQQPLGRLTAPVSNTLKQARSETIKQYATLRGLTNPVLVAGVANHETQMAQCYSDVNQYCQGPYSSYCQGPVLAGGGDGPCGDRAGGLGMFQFDSGNYDDTVNAYGADVLNLDGNSRIGVDTVIYKMKVCQGFSDDTSTIAYMNTALPGTGAYENYLTAMASCYNGCTPNLSCHTQRRLDYDTGVKELLTAFGNDFWYGSSPLRSSPQRVARDTEGRITLVARASDGTVYYKRQSSAGGSWGGWVSLSGALTQEPVIARNANGRLTVFGVGSDKALYLNHQTSSTAWTGWIRLGGSYGSHVAVGTNADGRLEVFGRGSDNALWRTNQITVNTSSWTSPVNMGGVLTSDVAVGLASTNRLMAFFVGTEGRFFRIEQTPSGWSAFLEMTGIKITSAPTAGLNPDGRLEIFARDTTNGLVHAYHTTTAATTWSSWSPLGGALTGAPVAGRNASNRIEVFVRNDRQGAHRLYQTATGWSPWVEMFGTIKQSPVPVNNSTGKLEIYAEGAEGFYRLVQQATDGAWTTTWELLGRP